MMSSLTGFGGQVWLHFQRLDLPALLARLAGLGYAVGSAYYLGDELKVYYIDYGVVAEKALEDGAVEVRFDERRTALGAVSSSPAALRQGLAEAYRALAESEAPEPLLVEAYFSLSAPLALKGGRRISAWGLELAEAGVILAGRREGLEVQISVAPIQGDRRLVAVRLSGSWSSVVPIVNNAPSALQELLSALAAT